MTTYEQTLDRSKFFQTVQAWPLQDELNYEGWLKNFTKGEEREIAATILTFFTHYSSKMIDQMFNTSVSNAGYIFKKYFAAWDHSHFQSKCLYSFIPGETINPTDSGHIFVRRLRDNLNVPQTQIINYNELHSKLSELNEPTPIIFVDDFVGSGNQVQKAWAYNKYLGKTLQQISIDNGHCAVYSPLIVNLTGYNHMTSTCHGLHLSPTHILGPEYCLFNKECICWTNDEYLYQRGTELILNKSKKLGIPSTNGRDVRDEMGYRKQGLAISFAHGAPDAIPAIFYWNTNNWTPLIPKHYDR